MNTDDLKTYAPLILGIVFIGYKYIKAKKIKALIPQLKMKEVQIVDVRSPNEFKSGNNPDSINIPLSEIASKLDMLKIGVPVIVCCATGTRSAMAKSVLKSKGFEVHNGGNWQNTL